MVKQTLVFYKDADAMKGQQKKRKKMRQSKGFAPKRRKFTKDMAELAISLPDDCGVLLHLRHMLIAAYLKVKDEETLDDKVLDTIERCCPPDDDGDDIINAKVLCDGQVGEILKGAGLEGIQEIYMKLEENGEKSMEAGLVIKVSRLLDKLKDYFPDTADKIKDTPYDCGLDEWNLTKEEDGLVPFAKSFKRAATVGHFGVHVQSGDGDNGDSD